MTENEIISSFLNNSYDTELEKGLQKKCKDLYATFESLNLGIQKMRQDLQAKELEFLKTKNGLEALYSLILDTYNKQ